MTEGNLVHRAASSGMGSTGSGKQHVEDQQQAASNDPATYDTWRLILSTPFTKTKGSALLREVLTGTTVALAMVPESIAFSFVAGVPPVVGLQASWMAMLICALLGGMPAQVSGATGALAVLLPTFVEENGVGAVFMAGIMMGLIEIVFGIVGGAKVVKLIGEPVMIGFANGLGLVIGIAQLHSYQISKFCPVRCDLLGDTNTTSFESACVAQSVATSDRPFACSEYITGATAGFQALETVVTFAAILLLPRLSSKIPSALAGILVGIIIEFALVRPLGYETPTVGDTASIPTNFNPFLPVWSNDDFKVPSLGDAETWTTCLPLAFTMAVVGLTESLLTLQLLSDITRRPGSGKAESLAQGVANCIVGVFGGLPICSLIGQSIISVSSGGRTRLAISWSAIFLLLIILVASPLLNLIPTASLAGLMFVVVLNTIQWPSFVLVIASFLPEKVRSHPKLGWIKKVHRADALAIILVTIIAVVVNLAVAVGTGVVLGALAFAWSQEKRLDKFELVPGGDAVGFGDDYGLDPDVPPEAIKVYQIKGPLFFASGHRFITMFNPEEDPEHVVLYLDQAVLADYSALVALNKVAGKYKLLNKNLHLRKVTGRSMRTIKKAHQLVYTYDSAENDEVNRKNLLDMSFMPQYSGVPIVEAKTNHMQGTDGAHGTHGAGGSGKTDEAIELGEVSEDGATDEANGSNFLAKV